MEFEDSDSDESFDTLGRWRNAKEADIPSELIKKLEKFSTNTDVKYMPEANCVLVNEKVLIQVV